MNEKGEVDSLLLRYPLRGGAADTGASTQNWCALYHGARSLRYVSSWPSFPG
jgi:hypothetical protein